MGHAELPPPGTVYRVMGHGSAWQRVGCGVLDKSGLRIDQAGVVPPTWSVVWILRGRGRYTDAAGRTVELAAGGCFQRWPGRRHSTTIDPGSGWREIFIDLGPALHAALAAMAVLRPDPPAWIPPADPARLARWLALRDALRGADDRDLPRLCVQAQALAVEAAPPPAAGDDPIARYCARLADGAGRRDDLRGFCRAEGLAYEAFRKRFRRRTGMSPGRYRIRRRLELACQLLQATDRPVAGIAAELGYASPFEFSAQFRRHLGMSPRAYRGG